MKKIALTVLSMGFCLFAHANAPFKKVQHCESDLLNGSYCSKANIQMYKQALKNQKANFDQKYILLNVGNTHTLELVALDTQTGIGYPLNYQFTGWENNEGKVLKKPTFQFSLNSPKVCLSGSQYDGEHPGTHETYSNIRNCFNIKTDGKHSGFESNYADQIQYEYLDKNKTWIPY